MSATTRSDDPIEQYETIADETGFSLLRLESEWWGNEKFGQWRKDVWGIVDAETDDAYHLAVASFDRSDLSELKPYEHETDVWLPKSKTEVVVEPDWTTFDADGDAKGEVLIAMERRTEHGWKVGLWGDTYDALSKDGDAALEDVWDELHAAYEGDGWAADEVNGILISRLTDAGYDVKIAEGMLE